MATGRPKTTVNAGYLNKEERRVEEQSLSQKINYNTGIWHPHGCEVTLRRRNSQIFFLVRDKFDF